MRRRQVLQIVFDRLVAANRWPCEEPTKRRLAGAGLPPDAVAKLPEKLCGRQAGKVVLTIRALRRLPSAADTLDDFLPSVRFVGSRYRDWEADPVVTVDELVEELSLSRGRAERVMTLLESESLVERRSREDGNEELVISPDVGNYATIRSCRAYVRKRAALKCNSRSIRPIRSLREWLHSREPSMRDLIVVACVAGIAILALTAALQGF